MFNIYTFVLVWAVRLMTSCFFLHFINRLPWPAYTASAWMIIDAATRRARSQLLAAIDAVGGTDARNLEPRLVTGTNAARSALGVPMLIVFLGAFIFPILVRVRAIELSNLCFV